ncbi:MAG TPA: DUF4282 domain-containing protein [Pseudonocardia sp.]|jgi:hypothetical protein|uniref:DUF4282 domain-containing protein n=1 Tax=Pseudonocardia sp. TaxID=60912 RepID=UPI002B4B18E1|nr:DUF4282 domain-containing protein [Pseudonocardia sp.]HLU55577.1 DUF4282 domain-containing protein [Pseudonocardia sp.]
MSNDPGAPGEYQPGQQGWQGGQQPPPYPSGFGQQQPPPAWGGYPPAQPGQPGQPGGFGPPPPPGQPIGGPQGQSNSPFAALFDFDFNTFATPAVVKILYIVGMILIGLFYIGALIGGFAQGVGPGLLALVVGGVFALFALIMFRVTLEFYYALVRMSEDIHHRKD